MFLRQQAASALACDFLTVETAFLQRVYVLFFISLATRRVEYIACTSSPDGGWVAQQARNLVMQLGDGQSFRLLIHDRDRKFSGAFDQVFRSEGIKVIRPPVQASNANAYAERWVRTVRADLPRPSPLPRPPASRTRAPRLPPALRMEVIHEEAGLGQGHGLRGVGRLAAGGGSGCVGHAPVIHPAARGVPECRAVLGGSI
jgi:hypothetical protein